MPGRPCAPKSAEPATPRALFAFGAQSMQDFSSIERLAGSSHRGCRASVSSHWVTSGNDAGSSAGRVHDEGPAVMTINDHDGTTADIADEPTSAIPRPVLGDRDSSLGPQKQSSMAAVEFVPPGAATLVISRGPNSGHKLLLDQPVTTVGRHPRSGVFLDDITVSRRHAELRWVNGEVRVVDVGSLNGSYVNGEAVESTVLVHGDELQFGKFRLTFVAASASEHL